jgi:transposase
MIDAAKPCNERSFVWCGALPGFEVRVYPSGRKVFVAQVLVGRQHAVPVVRANPPHKQREHFNRAAYRRRHKVENLWARLKEWRAMATRYDKIAASFRNALHLASAFQWLS